MALRPKGFPLPSLTIALILFMVAGCSPSADFQNETGSQDLAVSGQTNPAQLLASGENGMMPAPSPIVAYVAPMPFVRSRPKPVKPFPLILNQTVQRYVNQYAAQPEGLKQSFRRSQPYLHDMVRELEQQGLPPDLIYLAFAESGFSSQGRGPWQLEKDTARRFGLTINKWVDERRDPIKSTRAAAEYLASLHDAANSDWRTTLIAWNNGDSAVERYVRMRSASYERLMKKLPRHTRALMNRFMAVAIIARHASDYGLQDISYNQPPHYRTVKVAGGTPLSQLAKATHLTVEALREANPDLLRDRIPPNVSSYEIRLPDGELQAELAEF